MKFFIKGLQASQVDWCSGITFANDLLDLASVQIDTGTEPSHFETLVAGDEVCAQLMVYVA